MVDVQSYSGLFWIPTSGVFFHGIETINRWSRVTLGPGYDRGGVHAGTLASRSMMAVKKVVDTMMDLERKLVTFNMIICDICLCCVYMGVNGYYF